MVEQGNFGVEVFGTHPFAVANVFKEGNRGVSMAEQDSLEATNNRVNELADNEKIESTIVIDVKNKKVTLVKGGIDSFISFLNLNLPGWSQG